MSIIGRRGAVTRVMNVLSARGVTVGVAIALAQCQGPVEATQNEPRARRSYDAVVHATLDRLEMNMGPGASIGLTITTVYEGRQLARPPMSVELLFSRALDDSITVPDAPKLAVLADGQHFERHGTVAPRDIGPSNMAGVALVLRSDVFARLTDATVVAGTAFGQEFVLSPTQVVAMRTLAIRWHLR